MRVPAALAIGIWLALGGGSDLSAEPAWEKTITSSARGSFADPRPMRAVYEFGWNDLVAATAEINFSQTGDRLELTGSGQTNGLVRALWRYDVQHRATAAAATLRPLLMHQVDETRKKTTTTDLVFNSAGVVRTRTDTKSNKPAGAKKFDFPGLLDLHTALLVLRSQPLAAGSVQRLVVYPATNGYVATIMVVGRESIKVGAGTYPAIKLEVQLSKINKQHQLEPHQKFRGASAWISDDADRLLLRIEAQIFIGTVFVELQSVAFTGDKPGA